MATVFGLYLILAFAFSSGAQSFNLEEKVIERTLKNGLKVLIVERHTSPTVSFNIKVKAGSVDEQPGKTGLAHLLEHMLFKGTRTLGAKDYAEEAKLLDEIDKVARELDLIELGHLKADADRAKELARRLEELQKDHSLLVNKDEISAIYAKNGAVGFNASTGKDFTTYVVNLPSNKVELWARIEADRLENPVFREFYTERAVVMEERRRSYDSIPRNKLYEQFLLAAFTAHPYRNPNIGWMDDIKHLARGDSEDFFKSHYTPNNTTIAIVGDVRAEGVTEIIERYFGPIPSRGAPTEAKTIEPPQMGERRIEVLFDASPMLIVGYHKPTLPSKDDYAADLIEVILTRGRSSRLYKKIVDELALAVEISANNGTPGARYPNLFTISATPRLPHTGGEVEKAIYDEIEKLKAEKVSEIELKKAKNQLQADFIRGLHKNEQLASMLTYFQAAAGDWRYIANYSRAIEKISPDELQETVKKYLVKENRTVATLVPIKKK